MPKTKISEFDVDPANNTDINSINIAEGCAPSGINNAIRQLMSDLKEFQTGAAGDSFTVGGAFAANGGATLGDASGDALTINSSAVSIPNGLNFDSNTLVIDAANNRIAVNGSDSSVGGGQMVVNQANNNGLVINQTGSGNGASIYLRNATDTTINNFNFTNSGVRFFDVGTNSERMRIDSSGAVSIGASATNRLNLSYDGGSGQANIGPNSSGGSTFLTIGTSSSGTYAERMRIDSSGNVGIGVSNPSGYSSKLVVLASAGGTTGVFTDNTNYTFSIKSGGSGVSLIGGEAGNSLAFQAGASERMRIDTSGNLLVGTTANAGVGGFTVAPNSTEGAAQVNFNRNSTTNGSTVIVFRNAGTAVGSISYTNSTTTYSTSSDYRLKENIAPMTGALEKVSLLKPCTYVWKSTGEESQGFIAHELQEVVPDCVTGEKDAVDAEGKPVYQGIDTSFLVATLTASIQELKAIVDAQAARIAALESK